MDSPAPTAETPREVHVPDRTYLKVFLVLLVFTLLEYVYAHLAKDIFPLLVAGLVAMALTKAILVALYFMHLKLEGRWVFLLIAPTLFFATVLVLALYPDIGIGARPPGPPPFQVPPPPGLKLSAHAIRYAPHPTG